MNIKYILTVLFLISGTVLPFDVFAEIENNTTAVVTQDDTQVSNDTNKKTIIKKVKDKIKDTKQAREEKKDALAVLQAQFVNEINTTTEKYKTDIDKQKDTEKSKISEDFLLNIEKITQNHKYDDIPEKQKRQALKNAKQLAGINTDDEKTDNDDTQGTRTPEEKATDVKQKQDAYDKARTNENSWANRGLTAVTTAATGIGAMELAQGLSERKADAAAEADMSAYIATMRCEYGNGHSVKFDAQKEIELPGGNSPTLSSYINEYKGLASKLKSIKAELGMKPGIEEEVILDKTNMGLYDDEFVGITEGGLEDEGSIYRATALGSKSDKEKIDAEKNKTSNRVKWGAVALAGGTAVGLVGDSLINGKLGEKRNKLKEAENQIEEQVSIDEKCEDKNGIKYVYWHKDNICVAADNYFYDADYACTELENGTWNNDTCTCPYNKSWDIHIQQCIKMQEPITTLNFLGISDFTQIENSMVNNEGECEYFFDTKYNEDITKNQCLTKEKNTYSYKQNNKIHTFHTRCEESTNTSSYYCHCEQINNPGNYYIYYYTSYDNESECNKECVSDCTTDQGEASSKLCPANMILANWYEEPEKCKEKLNAYFPDEYACVELEGGKWDDDDKECKCPHNKYWEDTIKKCLDYYKI